MTRSMDYTILLHESYEKSISHSFVPAKVPSRAYYTTNAIEKRKKKKGGRWIFFFFHFRASASFLSLKTSPDVSFLLCVFFLNSYIILIHNPRAIERNNRLSNVFQCQNSILLSRGLKISINLKKILSSMRLGYIDVL